MNKIDFAIVITAEMCNPNGDPLMTNRPRIDLDGYGEMSSVCIKRKVRDRLQDMGWIRIVPEVRSIRLRLRTG